jgi:hypothetical protein
MMKQKHWTSVLEDERAQIDVRFRVAAGRIKDCGVNLSYLTDDHRIDVFRCDSAHGYIHAHKFWIADDYAGLSLEEALTTAYNDVKNHWREYVQNLKQAKGLCDPN